MSFGSLPVSPKESDVPLMPTNKWVRKDGALLKKYEFRTNEQRNDFVFAVLEHEGQVGHHADITISENSVRLVLQTKDVEEVTELDKEFSKWADVTFRDVCYYSKEKE